MKSHFYAFVLVNHFWIFFQFYFYWDWGDAAELNAVSRVETEHGFIEIADYISFKREEIEMHILCNFFFYHVYWLFIVSKCFKLLENKMKIFVPCLFSPLSCFVLHPVRREHSIGVVCLSCSFLSGPVFLAAPQLCSFVATEPLSG